MSQVNQQFSHYEVHSYTSQVVAGVNYFVKVKLFQNLLENGVQEKIDLIDAIFTRCVDMTNTLPPVRSKLQGDRYEVRFFGANFGYLRLNK